MIPATTSPSNWQRATKRVQSTLQSGSYVNAETTLLMAGPPRLSDFSSAAGALLTGSVVGESGARGAGGIDALFPIGQCEMFSLQQAQVVQKQFEIGSRRSYQAGGRVQVVGSLGTVLFKGPSLMRALYAYYPSTVRMANGKTLNGQGGTDSASTAKLSSNGASAFPEIFFEPGNFSASKDGDKPDSFFINLMSELFSHPFGLCGIIRTNDNRNYGGFYLEDCMITNHSFQISASSTLISEVVGFQADAAIPVEFSTSATPSGSSEAGAPTTVAG